MSQPDNGSPSRQTHRYEKAATDALSLLDWCIQYLADNGQGHLARQLARNRNHIRRRLKD